MEITASSHALHKLGRQLLSLKSVMIRLAENFQKFERLKENQHQKDIDIEEGVSKVQIIEIIMINNTFEMFFLLFSTTSLDIHNDFYMSKKKQKLI